MTAVRVVMWSKKSFSRQLLPRYRTFLYYTYCSANSSSFLYFQPCLSCNEHPSGLRILICRPINHLLLRHSDQRSKRSYQDDLSGNIFSFFHSCLHYSLKMTTQCHSRTLHTLMASLHLSMYHSAM